MYPSQIQLEHQPCPLGCTPQDSTLLIGADKLHGIPGEFAVVKCGECGLIRTNPRPTPESIGIYYPEDYGPYINTRGFTSAKQKSFWKKQLSRLIQFNTDVLPPCKPGKFLEIGCASGSFLHRMTLQGWSVFGIEPDSTSAEFARQRGYSVYLGPVETAPTPDEQFDLIAGWMVLEHLHDPIQALKNLAAWSHQDSWLALSVPNAGSLEFQLFKTNWYALQVPSHLYHYTPTTIKKVLKAGGWQVERIFHQRVISNLVVSLGYAMQEHQIFPSLREKFVAYPTLNWRVHQFFYPLAFVLSLMGQTGRMTIWARKSKA